MKNEQVLYVPTVIAHLLPGSNFEVAYGRAEQVHWEYQYSVLSMPLRATVHFTDGLVNVTHTAPEKTITQLLRDQQ